MRNQISSYLLQSRGIIASSDAIVIGSSTQQLLMHVSLLLRKQFSSIILENPGYGGARTVFELQGYDIEAIDVAEKGIRLEQLETFRFSF